MPLPELSAMAIPNQASNSRPSGFSLLRFALLERGDFCRRELKPFSVRSLVSESSVPVCFNASRVVGSDT
ncbi:MAG TPA: hypothetical protein VMB71_14415, partial [Acetobacteraceae bacterium]|nr:hypothetical protein [Acetobacteraceae bacterium]